MANYLITGPSGSGKTTTGNVLVSRGFTVIDTDNEPGLSSWVDVTNDRKAEVLPPLPWPQEWMLRHEFRWDAEIMGKLLGNCAGQATFFCGGAYNEMDFVPRFERVFGLQTSGEVLAERLSEREPARYQGNSPELQVQLEYNEVFHERCREFGYVIIDASVSPDEVVDQILGHVEL